MAPRLRTDGAEGVLRDFPDWLDLPATLRGVRFTFEFPALGISVSESTPATTLRRTSTPLSSRYTQLFPPTTLVRGRTLENFTRRRIRSYPVGHLTSFLADRYGLVGARFPDKYPSYDDMIVDSAFGPIAFEGDANGAKRRIGIAAGLENLFDLRPGTTPDKWAIPYDPNGAQTPEDIAGNALQLRRFHQRRAGGRGPLPAVPTPKFDVHEVVSMTREYANLQRMLGLVVDFEITDPRVVALINAPAQRTPVKVTATWTPALAGTGPINVTPRTMSLIGNGRFEAAPRDPQKTEIDRGLLKLDRPDISLVPFDVDGAALLADQYAGNLSRWGSTAVGSSATPDQHPLPALRTGGIGIAHLGRAGQFATRIDRAANLQDICFTPTGDARLGDAEVFLEDLVAGYKWDVFDALAGVWKSLMWKEGAYKFLRDVTTGRVPISEEAVYRTGPTSSGDRADTDLYLHEMVAQWSGWSLAVSQPGAVIGPGDTVQRPDGGIDQDFQFGTESTVPQGSLPRLRFGHTYRMRARIADIAGNSHPATSNDLPGDGVKTGPLVHRRFEPVPPPEALFRTRPTRGENVDRVVVRSDTVTSGTAQTSVRHILPPRVSTDLAVQHGKLDSDGAGRPLLADAFAMLAARDGARLEDMPSARNEGTSWYWDADEFPIPYLTDPLAKRTILRGLPGSTTEATWLNETGAQVWPDLRALRIRLAGGTTAGWTLNSTTKQLDVTLAPGDIYELTLTSCFNEPELDLMALWPWIQQWVAANPTSGVNLTTLAAAIRQGRHWMFTPRRTVTVVHAVKVPPTPTVAPRPLLSRSDVEGTTAALLNTSLTISRKCTGSVDLTGAWTMPVDNGPGTSAPTVQTFQSAADSIRVERAPGPVPGPDTLPVSVKHEFHDTKHRVVTYTAEAISAFVDNFRVDTTVTLGLDGTADVGASFVPSTVKVRHAQSGQSYRQAPAGDTDPATASGDYLVDAGTRRIKRTTGGTIPAASTLTVEYVTPPIAATSPPSDPVILNSTARPSAPLVHTVLPTFNWATSGSSSTRRGGLRIYLKRPWWSSGAGERLAIVLPNGTEEPSAVLAPNVTFCGKDPVFGANAVPDLLTISSFVGTAATRTNVELPDVPGARVDLALFDVSYDPDRDMWYSDVRIVKPDGSEHDSYFPFIRLALARYQANSQPGCHLSPVAVANIVQLTPERTATITGSGSTRTVTVSGRTFLGTAARGGTNRVVVQIEHARSGVTDPALKWEPLGTPSTLTVLVGAENQAIWTGVVSLPASREPLRLVIRELESHRSNASAESEHVRTVYLNTIDL